MIWVVPASVYWHELARGRDGLTRRDYQEVMEDPFRGLRHRSGRHTPVRVQLEHVVHEGNEIPLALHVGKAT